MFEIRQFNAYAAASRLVDTLRDVIRTPAQNDAQWDDATWYSIALVSPTSNATIVVAIIAPMFVENTKEKIDGH